MNDFINDSFPVIKVSRPQALEIVEKVIKLLPKQIRCDEKKVGPDRYMCRSLASISRQMRDDFEDLNWGQDIDFAGVAMDFVGLAIKSSSKYLLTIRTADFDRAMILSNIEAREDIEITP